MPNLLGKLVRKTLSIPAHVRTSFQDNPEFVANRGAWIRRRLWRPCFHKHCVIQHVNGLRIALRDDPLDDRIFVNLFDKYAPLFFPDGLEPFPEGGWILDVGAHHGIYAAAALHRYPQAKLIAVEPEPQAIELIKENLSLNGLLERAEIVEAAIADEEGSALLEHSDEGSWGNRLVKAPVAAPTDTVRTLRLESVLRGRQPHVVKCNAEGGEYAVVPQMLKLGLRPAFVILLLHPEEGDAPGLLQSLANAGYTVTPTQSSAAHPRYLCRLA